MSLVKIEDYTGSEIGKAAIEALEMIGVVNKLNKNGYHIAIEGIQEATPKGMIEDMPSKHKVVIERNKFAGNFTPEGFEKLVADNEIPDLVLKFDRENIDFDDSDGYEITHKIELDDSGYLWYNHKVEKDIDKSIVETDEGYVKRIFEDTANYIVKSFESME